MTTIEWTDETWNPVTGCTKVSTGCKNCYAERLAPKVFAGQFVRMSEADMDGHEHRPRRFTDVRTHPDRLDAPLRWRKPRRVFVNSMSDLFHDDVPDEFIDRVFAVMALAPQHTFQVLTKRPKRLLDWRTTPRRKELVCDAAMRMLRDSNRAGSVDMVKAWIASGQTLREFWTWPNVWLGVSVEDQRAADERIPLLLQTPAAVRFLSCEPLLGPIRLDSLRDDEVGARWTAFRPRGMREPCDTLGVDWVIAGGESGPGARPCDVAWIRSIVQQCKTAGVACFVKQLGGNVRDRNDAGFLGDFRDAWDVEPDDVEHDLDGTRDGYQGAPVRVHLRDRKGGDHAEWPEDLRVREFPNCVGAR